MEQNFVDKKINKLDRWVNYFVRHTWVKSIVFIIAFLETTISPLAPEIVVAGILAYRKDISWKLLSLVSAFGSLLGVSTLFFLGKYFYLSYKTFFDNVLDSGVIATYTEQLFSQNTFVTIFIASFTPLPDRVFAFLSGVFSLQFIIVALAFFTARLLRVSIFAYFSYHFGDEAKNYILKHTKLATIMIILVLIVYFLIKYQVIL